MSETETKPAVAPNGWLSTLMGLAAGILVLAGSGALSLLYLQSRPVDLRQATLNTAATIETTLISNRVPESNIRGTSQLRSSERAEYHFFEYEVAVPAMLDPERLLGIVRRQLQDSGVSAAAARGASGEPMLELALANQPIGYVRLRAQIENPWDQWPNMPSEEDASISEPSTGEAESLPDLEPSTGSPENPQPEALDESVPTAEEAEFEEAWMPPVQVALTPAAILPPLGRANKMRVAIILDDGGYGGATTERVLALDPRLTLSILPYTPHAKETAERATALGFEVMLHMPMENLQADLRHEGQIDVGMSAATIQALTTKALEQVPGAVGVNNHMGSKFTSDKLHMGLFVEAIRGSSLYFVDSRTTADSRAYDVAWEAGMPSGYRNLFLDHINDPIEIEKQFEAMIKTANETGSAIVIGHFRPATVDVLEKLLPTLEERGVELVHASELVK